MIVPRPLKKVREKITPFSQEDKIPTFNLGSGTADSTTVLHGDGTWQPEADLSGYVPYTGATSDLDLGEHEIKAGQVEFDQSPTGTPGVAVMRWNDTDGTADLGLKGGNVTLQIGQEQVVRVVNKSTVDLLEANYQAVKVSGATGQRLSVHLAQADSDFNSATTIGLVTETISKNQEGFITTSGQVKEINTTGSLQGETWSDGDVLYLSPTTAGNITNVKPIAPQHLIVIGYVEYAHAIHGKIFVKVDNGYELDELHNVLISSPLNDQVLQYESATSLWKNKTIDKSSVGLGNVDNTSDINKPVSTAQQTALNLKFNTPTGTTAQYVSGDGSLLTFPSLGLTVGSTAISSGTDGRVLFQNGGVLQQSANFTFASGTLKVISSGTSESLLIRNSANTADIFSVLNGGAVLSSFLQVNGSLTSNIQFNSTNNSRWVKVQHDYGQLEFTNSLGNNTFTLGNNGVSSFSGNVNIGGGTNGARLDVKAQGALSTDIALRVRNSANTADLFSVLGNGTTALTTLVATNVINISQPAGFYYPTLNFSNNGGAGQGSIFGYNGRLNLSSSRITPNSTLSIHFGYFDGNYAQLEVKAKDALSTSNSFGILDSALSMYFFKVQNNGAIGIGTSTTLSASAKVQIDSTTQGFLPPRMTNAQRIAIASPAVGLMVYCTDAVEGLYVYKSTGWTFVI